MVYVRAGGGGGGANLRRRYCQGVTEKRSFEHSDSDMMRWWKISDWLIGIRVATPTRELSASKEQRVGLD